MVATTELESACSASSTCASARRALPPLESGARRVAARLPAAAPRRAAAAPAAGVPAVARLDRGAGAHEPAPRAAHPAPRAARRRPLPRGHATDAALAAGRAAAARRRRVRGRAGAGARRRRRRPARGGRPLHRATCSRAPTTSGCSRSASACASATSTRSSASRDGWPSAGDAARGDRLRRAARAPRPAARGRPTGC